MSKSSKTPFVYQFQASPVQPGTFWQHYKGDHYRVMTLAQREDDGATLVVYRNRFGEVYSRPLSEWLEIVTVDDQQVSRFTYEPNAHWDLEIDRPWVVSAL